MTAMLPEKSATDADSRFNQAEERLIAAAGDHGAALRSALTSLEDALRAKKQKQILDAARSAMTASDHCDAAMRERLRQHIAVRCGLQHISQQAINAAVGGSPRWNAYYFRLLARTLEDQQTLEAYAEAATVWADFRREAIKETWFAAGGLQDGVLALHMAELIEKVPAEIIEDLKQERAFYRRPGKWSKEEDGLASPGTLYERACRADPHPEAFHMWLSWARKHGFWQVADSVAEQWRNVRAADIQPLLYLMESAEKRNAFKKSLKYLEEAENLDRLNPEVRRAKLRLLLAAAIRHLQQRKTHLVLAGIEQIETVPEVRPGEIAALASALRWFAAAVDKNQAVQDEQEAELNRSMGSVAAHLLMTAMGIKSEIGPAASLKALKVAKISAAELLAGVVRAWILGEWSGLSILLPREWDNPLIAAVKLPNCPADTAQMLVLGEVAVNSYSAELGYAISAAGLAKGGANAEFLFLRARTLPQWASLQREGCLTASLEVARRERNTRLAGRILDYLSRKQQDGRRGSMSNMDVDPKIASRPVSPELLRKILEEEQTLKPFPGHKPNLEPKYAEDLDYVLCDCPKCRAKRGEPMEDGHEYVDDEEDDFVGSGTSPMPDFIKGIAKLMGLSDVAEKELKKAFSRGENPKIALDRILGERRSQPELPASSRSKKDDKTTKASPPEQGSLF